MKDLIRQIACSFFRYFWNVGGTNAEEAFDEWLKTEVAVEILQSHPVIHCKALRKRGTDKIYYFNGGAERWEIDGSYFPVYHGKVVRSHFSRLPKDAELIDLTIIVENNL